ncbi:MAG: peptidoglycan DD-metalloendopeptidase family protein [Anaerolineae bacterium]|nr:peptidoglycan DD-metalloendopeptidase family protein [Anaerolineae bacterium]
MQISQRKVLSFAIEGGQALRRGLENVFVRAFAWLATTVYRCAGDWRGWRPFLTRTSAHLAVVVVAVAVIGLNSVKWPAQTGSVSAMSALPAAASGEDFVGSTETLMLELNGKNGESLSNGNGTYGAVPRMAQPHTTIPERPRLGVETYIVQAGDTVQSIAAAYNLEPTTIMWANPTIEDAPDLLRIGQEVIILPIDGAYHTVTADDTLDSLAETYKVVSMTIATCEYNNLAPPDYTIKEGDRLIIPGGEKPYVPKVVTSYTGSVPGGARGTGRFQWPVVGARITQGFWHGHRAIDLGAPTGSAVQAADGGFVSFAGWTDVGYGYLIVIDHANGFATYYAHLSNIYVEVGQAVERGQVIGAVGSTGWSTGPHLHFEIRYYGEQLNPRAHLP